VNGGWVSFAIHTICDAGVAEAKTHRHPPRHPKLVLTTTILASSLAFIDGSVVNVGLPAISTTFHAGAEDLQWVVNAYLLPLSALLLLGGGAGDHFGRVRGWLIDTVGWRSIFLVNIPLAVGAIVLALAFVRDTPTREKRQPLDILGGALATLALGGLTWGLTIGSGPSGWASAALPLLAAGFALLVAFVWVEKIRGEDAMMPLVLFASSGFIGLTFLTLLLYGALGGLIVLLPHVLIRAAEYSGTAAGATLLPFAVVLTLTSPLMGSLAGRVGSRVPLSVRSLMVAAGFLLILRIGPGGEYWTSVLPALLLIAFGMAGAVAPLTTAVLASVDARHTGSASGAVARTGGLVATALLGGVFGAVGPHLIEGFHIAAAVGALVSVGAATVAFLLVTDTSGPVDAPPSNEDA
jgi:MFS family permease